jgi:hypothetical protein
MMKWRCIHHEREDVDEAVAEVGVEVAEEEDVEEMMADEMEVVEEKAVVVAEEKAVVVAEEKAVVVAGVAAGVVAVAEGVEKEGTKAVLRYVNFKYQNNVLPFLQSFTSSHSAICTTDEP